MFRHSTRIALTTAAVVGTLGVGIAAAADLTPCPCGNTPQAAQSQDRDTGQQRLRKRDGTGPRHAQRSQQRSGQGPMHRQGGAGGLGNRGAQCPYRN